MSQTEAPAFTLKLGAREELAVACFSGTEALSQPFDIQVEFIPKNREPLQQSEVLGQTAVLGIQCPGGKTRYLHGQVHRVEFLGSRGGYPRYRIQIVPKLHWLTDVRRSRIFQQKSTPDIVKQVLSDAGVEFRWAAGGSYAAREYCVQYRETDFDFISRLMEWEGLFYFFEHSAEKHLMVVGDDAGAFAAMPGGAKLPFRERTGQVPRKECMFAFATQRQVRSASVMTRDFDFKKPSLDLTATAEGADFTGLELYDYAEGYVAPGEGKRLAKVRLQEAQGPSFMRTGESACPRLCPGATFELEAPAPNDLAGKYVTVRVRHYGRRPETPGTHPVLEDGLYHNAVDVLLEGAPFRPARRTPRPVVPGIQTATVVGPPGEEIHPDVHGRIKVQFHWDRDGKRDDKSSCWLRVAQVWGGPAWGGLFLPRMGQEVVVRFLEGDPDRPLITGAVYNGQNTTPYPLPDEKTKSTLKSNSSLGGDGFNELRIEDAAGEEEIFVHAQKDETLLTENDKAQEIRGYEDLLVKKDRKKTVEGNQRLRVLMNDMGLVEQNQSLRVSGNRTTAVRVDHDETVKGNQSVSVSGAQSVSVAQTGATSVGLAAALTVGASYAITVALASTEAVGGLKSEQVAGISTEYVVGSRDEVVEKARAAKIGGDLRIECKGMMSLGVGKDSKEEVGKKSELGVKENANWSAKSFALKADTFNLIVGGNKILTISKSGNVKWAVKTITIDGSNIKAKGSKIKLDPAGALVSKEAKLQKIQALEEEKLKHAVHVKVQGVDPILLAGLNFEVKHADGSKASGSISTSGTITTTNGKPGNAELSFTDLVK